MSLAPGLNAEGKKPQMRAAGLLLPSVVALSLVSAAAYAAPQQKPLTVEAVYARGSLIGNPPQQLSWSPDGRHLTYIDSGQMMEIDAGTGKTHVLISREKLAPLIRQMGTEQELDHRARYHMKGYFWAPDGKHMMFDSAAAIWIYDLQSGTGVQVAFTNSAEGDDPKFSPDGAMVSFIRDHGLTVVRLREPGTPVVAVAPALKPNMLNGEVDWIYEEELDVRSNYFWSPDSKNLAFLQMNEAAVPLYPLVDWIPIHPTIFAQHYPQPGDANPEVRVGVVSAKGSRVVWANLPFASGEDYIPRFGWVDAKTLWIEMLTRDQKHRSLYFADAASGETRKVLEIDDSKFLDDNYDVSVGHGHIVLSDWESGHNQLYLYSYNAEHPLSESATLVRPLTKGDFEVGEVYVVDDQASVVDYATNEANTQEQQLWEVNFDGDRRQLSSGAGFHQGTFAKTGGGFVDKKSTRMDPPTFSICREMGMCRVFWKTGELQQYRLHAPEQYQVKASDGTILHATLLLPEGKHASASVPMIVNPYGGPGEQQVQNRWDDGLLFDEILTQHGFAVLHAENRGMSGRGREFAQAAYRDFGKAQLQDQLTAIDAALSRHPELDPKRLGWWGWSWGGTFTLYAMTHSDRFRAGVAVAPVTNWREYDSIYTERYLGDPEQFPDGYRDFSPVSSAANLKGRLLLVHGTGDDNVHFGNTVQFVQALVESGISYNLQIFPRKTHSLSGPRTQTGLYRSILAFFEECLMPPASGANAQ
jgi:dipeptidyl-peptidase-4